jgi:hypothetical protein
MKLSFGGGNSGIKKCKRANNGGYGVVCVWGVCSQVFGFVLVRLAAIWLQSP